MTSTMSAARLDPEMLEPVFQELGASVARGDVPTAALAVGNADGPLRSEAFAGRADRRVTGDSIFFLASVTKPIVATAMMQLVEAGRLELHAPLSEFLPSFSVAEKRAVTVWHLLTHTSGVPDVPADLIRRERPSAARMTELASTAPLRFEPGTRWEYCSSSFYLLGEVIHRLSGLPYRQYLDERLFEPLDMTHTTFDPRRLGRHLVPVHGVGADSRLRRYFLLRYLVSIAPPGGGLWGTLDDMLRFGAALLRPRQTPDGPSPLSPETVALMGDDHVRGLPGTVDGEEQAVHFGLGWGKPTLSRSLPGSPRVMSHGGATGARLWIDPDADLVFVYFTNQWAPERGPELAALSATYEAMAGR